jgi:hypothetical protein
VVSAGASIACGAGSGSTGFEIAGGDGGLIFEIGGSTERVSVGSVDSVFFGRFSSISDTVSGFGAGGVGFACAARADSLLAVEAGAGSGFGSGGRALLIGGTPERLAGRC